MNNHPLPFPSGSPEQFAKQAVMFLQQSLRGAGFSHVLVGVSGGIDSAVTLALCVAALGPNHVHALFLPCGILNRKGADLAQEALVAFGIPKKNSATIDIQPAIDAFVGTTSNADSIRLGNSMARIRMIYLYDAAKQQKCLVVGTENRSEYLLGYFTRFGDEASDVELIQGLYKTHVRMLAEYLCVPTSILTATPTAGLWEGQTDEGEFGFSYAQADQILYYYVDKKYSSSRIIALGFEDEIVRRVLAQMKKNMFKHHTPFVFHPV